MSGRTEIKNLKELIQGSIDGELVEQTLGPLVLPGENFGSVMYKVDLKVKNKDKEETYHTVAKCTPTNKVTQEIFNIQVTIKAEIGWYTTLIPTFINFQREHGVEEVADFFQKFYGARINLDPKSDIVDIDAVILTENLKPLGYETVDRHVGFDLKTSKSILRNLAVFHAVPIAIKLQNKKLFDKNIKPYLPGIPPDPTIQDKDQFKDIKNGFRKIPDIFPYMDRIVSSLEQYKLRSTLFPVKEPWGSICHNDFWINNIMVKNDASAKMVFLDFQMPSYGSVAVDLIFFLVVSVAQDAIAENMDKLIKLYWNELVRNLKLLGVDDSLFIFEEFLKEVDRVASFSLFGRTLFHIYIILVDKGRCDWDSSDENFKMEDFEKFDFTFNDKHIEKYKWIVLEFVKRGWI